MQRHMLKSKIHRATITEADLNYEGSLTIDRELMDAVDLHPYERVMVYNIHNGERFDTYVIEGSPGSGVIGLNGMGIFLGDNDIGIDTMLRHLRHVSDLVGSAHIGIGFDYSPEVEVDIGVILRSRPDYWPAGQQYDPSGIKHAGPAQLPQLVDALADADFDDDAIRGFLGENFQRVAACAWRSDAA